MSVQWLQEGLYEVVSPKGASADTHRYVKQLSHRHKSGSFYVNPLSQKIEVAASRVPGEPPPAVSVELAALERRRRGLRSAPTAPCLSVSLSLYLPVFRPYFSLLLSASLVPPFTFSLPQPLAATPSVQRDPCSLNLLRHAVGTCPATSSLKAPAAHTEQFPLLSPEACDIFVHS